MSVENLLREEAVKKIKELVKASDICMFTTSLTQLPLNARPMSSQDADEEGNIWFFSNKTSDKNIEIEKDNRVQLFYVNNSGYEYLSVYGRAEISTDKQKIDEYWSSMVKAWFPEGKDDPNLTLIKVTPEDAYYWDTKNNKLVSLIKIMASVVTGKTSDDGVEGQLKV